MTQSKKKLKVYIATDLEGASGLIAANPKGDIGEIDSPYYQSVRRFLTGDVNAAIKGALEGGADEIIVHDGHGTPSPNIFISELHPKAKLNRGAPGNWLPGLDSSIDAALLIGTHAMAGTKRGFLDHTQSSTTVYNWYLNNIKVGEIGQMAAIAGHYRVPVVFVAGDLAATIEAKKLLGNIETVSVKEGISRNRAVGLTPSVTRKLIRKHTQLALKKIKKIKPFILKKPITMKVELYRSDYAEEYAAGRHGNKVTMPDSRTVIIKMNNILEMF